MITNKVYFSDCRSMKEIGDESVQLIVTSPPYWNMKDYGPTKNQIGFGETYTCYLMSMQEVFNECHRVLNSGCKMVVNIGDQFCSKKDFGFYHIRPLGSAMIQLGLESGFKFMGDIIWKKTPSGCASGGAKLGGSLYYPRDGALNITYEHIIVFKKLGDSPVVSDEAKEKSKLTKDERTKWFTCQWDDIAAERQKEHPAMFPVEIPRRIIKMFSFYGETVLDPFLGSGTTMKAANILGRHCIGYELNADYMPIIKDKVVGGMNELLDCDIKFIHKKERVV